jgi:hypothetical protein
VASERCVTDWLTPWSWILLEKPPVAQLLRISPNFMEPKGSLPCSQNPSTGSYSEPDQSSRCHPILSL